MKYNCKRCGYSCEKKHHLIAHIKRIRLCPPDVSDISRDDLFKDYPEYIETKARSFPCKHCNKEFRISQSMYRHQKICKSAKVTMTRMELDNIKKEMLNKLKSQMEEQLLNMMSGSSDTSTMALTVNGGVTMNTSNNINIVYVNGLNKTDYSEFSIHDIRFALGSTNSKPEEFISEFIKDVHFNKYYEQNHNVQILNRAESKVLEDNNWLVTSTNDCIKSILTVFFDALGNKINDLDDMERNRLRSNTTFMHNLKYLQINKKEIDTSSEPWNIISDILQEASNTIHKT